jgi:hypothetical protein
VTSGLATGIGSGAGAESLTIIIEQGYTGKIGSVTTGTATPLSFSSTLETLNVYIGQKSGEGSPTGSTRIIIDSTNVTAATAYIYDSASSGEETYYPPILLSGTWTVHQSGGSAGLAARTGTTGTATAWSIAPDGNPFVSPKAYFGLGATVTRLDAATGAILSRSSNTTATLNLDAAAVYTYEGSGVHTAVSIDSNATFLDKGSGATIATLNLTGTYQRRATSAITVGGTAANFYEGCTYDLRNGKAGTTTTSNKSLVRCGLGEIKVYTNPGENW